MSSPTFPTIEDVEIFAYSDTRSKDYADLASPMDKYPAHRHRRPSWYRFMDRVLVAVHGAGFTGFGVSNGGAITRSLVGGHLRPLLIGRELRDVEELWQLMHDSMLPFGASGLARMALSSVDIALWDLLARCRQVPVYELLGGAAKTRIPAYATTIDVGTADQQGFVGAKVTASVGPWDPPDLVGEWLDRLERERARVGDSYPLMVDAWMGWDLEFTLDVLPRLAMLGVDWLEEPFPPNDFDSYAALGQEAARRGVRIAAGEHHASVLDAQRLLETGAVQVLQPDVTWCGGITELRRIIASASRVHVPVCPHFGGEVWALHVMMSSDSCELAEWYVDVQLSPRGAPREESADRLAPHESARGDGPDRRRAPRQVDVVDDPPRAARAPSAAARRGVNEEAGVMTTTDPEAQRKETRRRYAEAARDAVEGRAACDCGNENCVHVDGASGWAAAIYEDEVEQMPETAVLASLGCGNPTAVADLRQGETVLDLGSGGGLDVILSARRVGESGMVYGLDMTDEMLALAEANANAAGVGNVRFLKGQIEAIPLPPGSVDVVISNCVINLSTDKGEVFAEMARVLRPGGRIGVSDIVAEDDLSDQDRARAASEIGCTAGALTKREYAAGLENVGFDAVSVEFTYEAAKGLHGAIVKAKKPR